MSFASLDAMWRWNSTGPLLVRWKIRVIVTILLLLDASPKGQFDRSVSFGGCIGDTDTSSRR